MDIFKTYATDEEAEVDGVEVRIGSNAYVTVARARNQAYVTMMMAEYEKVKDVITDNDELDKEITAMLMAKTILRGWRGIKYKGEDLPYSIDNAIKVLKIKDFRRRIVEISEEIEHYKFKSDEEDAKN